MMKKRVVIDVSDGKISSDLSDVLVTYSLGSCIGVCMYDTDKKIGGLLHYQLPDSKMNPEQRTGKSIHVRGYGNENISR